MYFAPYRGVFSKVSFLFCSKESIAFFFLREFWLLKWKVLLQTGSISIRGFLLSELACILQLISPLKWANRKVLQQSLRVQPDFIQEGERNFSLYHLERTTFLILQLISVECSNCSNLRSVFNRSQLTRSNCLSPSLTLSNG